MLTYEPCPICAKPTVVYVTDADPVGEMHRHDPMDCALYLAEKLNIARSQLVEARIELAAIRGALGSRL